MIKRIPYEIDEDTLAQRSSDEDDGGYFEAGGESTGGRGSGSSTGGGGRGSTPSSGRRGGESPFDPDDLIAKITERRYTPSSREVDRLLDHMGRAGFDPNSLERVRGRLAGFVYEGRALGSRDALPPEKVKHAWHVEKRQEWPVGTSRSDFVRSIEEVIRKPDGVFVSNYLGVPHLGVVRRTGNLQGPGGAEWVLVEYRVEFGYWVTAYQLGDDPQDVESDLRANPRRRDLRWLRGP